MPLNTILKVELFDVWGLDLWIRFHLLTKTYLFLAMDYISKWVKDIASPTNDSNVVVKFLKK